MITNEQVDLIIERLIERVQKANILFLKNIGSSLKQIRQLTPSEAHQLIQILKYGGNYDQIVQKITKYMDLDVKEVDKIFKQYSKLDRQFAKDFYRYRKVSFDESAALQSQRVALTQIIQNEMYDFTRSNVLGYTINGEFFSLRDTYNRLLDEAFLNVGQGKESFDSAMTKILKDIGGNGLKTVDYESGRSVRLDSTVRMHLKQRLRELHNENQKIIGEEIQADGIEISVHENPAEDHEDIQGRQFTIEEFEKLQQGLVAKDYNGELVSLDHDGKNGYRPISEMNCYHYAFSVILGINKPEYNKEQLREIRERNDKGFDFDGKHYTMYEGTQLQRKLEREIRKNKDIQILARQSGDQVLVNEAQQNITALTNKYKKLSDVSDLPTKMKRMSVSGYHRIKTYTNTITQNSNIITASHITIPENRANILKEGFSFSKNGSQAGSTWGKGVYFTDKQREIDYYKWRIDNSVEMKADIDTTGFLKVDVDHYVSGENFANPIVEKFTEKQKNEYNSLLKKYNDDNKIAERMSNEERPFKEWEQYWHINVQQDAVTKILQEQYPGLIINQNTEAIDIITGGSQIVVYDLKRIKKIYK